MARRLWHRLFGHGPTPPPIEGKQHFWACGNCGMVVEHNNDGCPGPYYCEWWEEERHGS